MYLTNRSFGQRGYFVIFLNTGKVGTKHTSVESAFRAWELDR